MTSEHEAVPAVNANSYLLIINSCKRKTVAFFGLLSTLQRYYLGSVYLSAETERWNEATEHSDNEHRV